MSGSLLCAMGERQKNCRRNIGIVRVKAIRNEIDNDKTDYRKGNSQWVER